MTTSDLHVDALASENNYERYALEEPEPGEKLVEMECCGFRFSAIHTDGHREGYTCPCCAPFAAAHSEYRDSTMTTVGSEKPRPEPTLTERIAEKLECWSEENLSYQEAAARVEAAMRAVHLRGRCGGSSETETEDILAVLSALSVPQTEEERWA